MKFKLPSISTIIILVIAYNIFFSDDDEDTKNVDVNKNDENSIIEEAKDVAKEVKAEIQKTIKAAKEKYVKEKEEVIEADDVVINTKEIIIVNEDEKKEKLFSDQPKEKEDSTLPKLEFIDKESENEKPLFKSID